MAREKLTDSERMRRRRASSARTYQKHKERYRAQQKAIHENNKEERNKQAATYRLTPRARYAAYARGAESRGYDFELTFEEFETFWGAPCYYCGVSMEGKVGIDRVMNGFGYYVGNTVSCCSTCNRMKSKHSKAEFLEQVRRIYEIHLKDTLTAP